MPSWVRQPGPAADSDLFIRSETGRRHRLVTQSPPKQDQHRMRHANRGVLRDHAACQPTRAIEPDPHTPRQPTTNPEDLSEVSETNCAQRSPIVANCSEVSE